MRRDEGDPAAASRAAASAAVIARDGRPVLPCGGSTSEATFRPMRSLASACRTARTSTLCVLAMVRVDRVWASLLSVRLTSCAVRSRRGTFPISIVTGRSRSTCDRIVLSARPSRASAAQSPTALDTV